MRIKRAETHRSLLVVEDIEDGGRAMMTEKLRLTPKCETASHFPNSFRTDRSSFHYRRCMRLRRPQMRSMLVIGDENADGLHDLLTRGAIFDK